jgi:hypothetical protein
LVGGFSICPLEVVEAVHVGFGTLSKLAGDKACALDGLWALSPLRGSQQFAQERAPTGCGQPRSLPLAADGFTGITLEAEVPGAAREEAAWAEVASASTLAAVRAAAH